MSETTTHDNREHIGLFYKQRKIVYKQIGQNLCFSVPSLGPEETIIHNPRRIINDAVLRGCLLTYLNDMHLRVGWTGTPYSYENNLKQTSTRVDDLTKKGYTLDQLSMDFSWRLALWLIVTKALDVGMVDELLKSLAYKPYKKRTAVVDTIIKMLQLRDYDIVLLTDERYQWWLNETFYAHPKVTKDNKIKYAFEGYLGWIDSDTHELSKNSDALDVLSNMNQSNNEPRDVKVSAMKLAGYQDATYAVTIPPTEGLSMSVKKIAEQRQIDTATWDLEDIDSVCHGLADMRVDIFLTKR